MKSKDFLRKLGSRYLWGNLAAMAAVVALLCLGVKYGLAVYTHHNESIPVPNLRGMDYDKAAALIERDGLQIVVSDSGYNKTLPGGCVLAQTPDYGASVKAGRIVYVTVNSPSSPTVPIPDIVDNSSVREATAKLRALGFVLLEPSRVTGEKDWVYGIDAHGRRLSTGDRVAVGTPLRLLVGDGQYDEGDVDVDHYDGGYGGYGGYTEMEEVDEFEEVPASVPHDADKGSIE